MTKKADEAQRMEKIVSLCKRRGFIFQASEIYGGLNGVWDYGPLGVELKRNLKDYWWRVMVHERDDVVGMDGAILTHRAVLKASGHEDTFSDPMVDCRLTNQRLRADQIPAQSGTVFTYESARDAAPSDEALLALAHLAENDQEPQINKTLTWNDAVMLGKRIVERRKLSIVAPTPDPESIEKFFLDLGAVLSKEISSESHDWTQRFVEGYSVPNRRVCGDSFRVLVRKGESESKAKKLAVEFYKKRQIRLPVISLKSREPVEGSRDFNPENGAELTPPRPFNLMFPTQVGASAGPDAIAYLRPETAQSIFVQFRNVLDTSRMKLPFGIAQIGKAFRNEINPRNYIFRSREFEQMELEYFCRPEEGMKLLDYWLEERLKFYEDIGLPREHLHVLTVPDADRAFYSKGTYDIEYDFPFGRQELEGVAYRTDYDLTQHHNSSGKPLDYFDEETKQRFIPHVVEPSAGVDRTVLALICEAYAEETVVAENGKSETRTVMRFHPRIAPIKAGVFPLLKNQPALVEKARQVQALLRPHMNVFYDESGAIGRRYRRQDEAGTPFGITIDFETLGERDPALRDTVTLRDRDSMKQERVAIGDLVARLTTAVA